jgi:HSP20 family protein
MVSIHGDPFEALFALQRALNARLDSDWMGERTAGTGPYPPINIFQKNDDLVAVIELPGVNKSDLQIEAKESTIRISGKKSINYEDGASVHRRERPWGVFDRTLSVPIPVAAGYRDAVLTLLIPRAESAKPRKIYIG